MALDKNDPFVKQALEQGVPEDQIQSFIDNEQQKQAVEQQVAQTLPQMNTVSKENQPSNPDLTDAASMLVAQHPVAALSGAAALGSSAVLGPKGYNLIKDVLARVPVAANNIPPVAPAAPPMPAPAPSGSNVYQFARNAAAAPQVAPQSAPAAAQESSLAQRAGQLYNRYAPAVGETLSNAGRAVMESPVARVGGAILNNPLTRFAGSSYGAGLMALAHSGELNTGEDAAMARIHQLQDQQMAQKWTNSPTPNAINSGFTGQLNNLSRQGRR